VGKIGTGRGAVRSYVNGGKELEQGRKSAGARQQANTKATPAFNDIRSSGGKIRGKVGEFSQKKGKKGVGCLKKKK